MSNEVLKSFLVALGFDVDEAGRAKFEATLAGATKAAVGAGAAIEGAALAVVAFTTKIASGLDNLYWASQRTGATVQGIKAVGFAVTQMGGDSRAALASMEGLASFLRNSPGAEGFLNRLGIETRGASGQMRDMSQVFDDVGRRLSSMPYYRANQYAQMLGIDEGTLQAMRRGLGQYQGEYAAMAKAIGFNADQAARSSNRFITSLTSFSEMAGMARDKIGANIADGLAGSIDTLRHRIINNFPKIEAVITRGVKIIMTLADMINHLVFRLLQAAGSLARWWSSLSSSTRQLIALFGTLAVALRVLSSAFWMSPIGIITALAGAIALLWDDYQTWREGGQSLVKWEKWIPEVDAALAQLGRLRTSVSELKNALMALLGIDPKSWSLQWDFDNFIRQMGEFGRMLDQIANLLNALKDGRWREAASIGRQLMNQGEDNADALPAVSDSANRTADWIQQKTGFDPRSIGRALTGGGGEPVAGDAPRGIRNNNPGNIDFRGQRGAELERPGGRFAKFQTAYDGLHALARQLMRYFEGKTTGRKLQNVRDIISTWAPGNENNTAAYIAQISRHLGVSPDAALNLRDPATLSRLMGGIIHHENGRNPYSSELVSSAARQVISPSLQQATTINIYGASDPAATGADVARRQGGVNSQMSQQVTGGLRG